MPRYIDAEKLCGLARNLITKSVDCNDIMRFPTADVQEVRYGEWIESEYGTCHCSECGYEYESQADVTMYCPDCGARMDGGESDES